MTRWTIVAQMTSQPLPELTEQSAGVGAWSCGPKCAGVGFWAVWAPASPLKCAGVGAREMGKTAIDFFTEEKSCYVDYTGTLRSGHTY